MITTAPARVLQYIVKSPQIWYLSSNPSQRYEPYMYLQLLFNPLLTTLRKQLKEAEKPVQVLTPSIKPSI